MKKALAAVAVLAVIGIGLYILFKPAPSGAPSRLVVKYQNGQTLANIVSAGIPATCTFSTTTTAGNIAGTVYIANDMVAGDFTSSSGSSSPLQVHLLVRDGTHYAWTSLSSQGFKSTIGASSSSSYTKAVEYNKPMDYTCSNWTPDPLKFIVPSTISFGATATYTRPPQGAGATGAAPAPDAPKGTKEMCAKCSQFKGAQRAQCLTILQC